MIQKEIITVITVTYNAEKNLESTIKSVLSQDYKNIEYIIIDGSSNDNTIEIIKKYQKSVAYWISENDSGIYDAMNKGIVQASGEWVNFLNAGDTFCTNNTVSTVQKYLDKSVDLVSGDIYYIEKNKKRYCSAKGTKNHLDGMFCYHQTLFTRISVLSKYKFDLKYKIAGDYDFVLKCYQNGYNFKFLKFPIVNYLAGGISESNDILARIEDLFIQSRYLIDLKEIFNSTGFHKLALNAPNKNYQLTLLLNSFYTSIDQIVFQNRKIVLYGFGHIGKIIYNKYRKYIVSIVDKNATKLNTIENCTINNLNSLFLMDDEYILISVLGREKEIEKELINKYKVNSLKILKVSC